MKPPQFKHAWRPGNLPSGVGKQRPRNPKFDPLTAPAHLLQDLLQSGEVKSTEIVEQYIWRIEKHNSYLNAVSEYAPDVMERASEMDQKRAKGEFLGPLHGIPILLKDNMCTVPELGMQTTAGAVALLGARCKQNAEIVRALIEAGAVILGKTTMSELAFYRDSHLPCGWSAVAGLAQSPYVRGGADPNDSVGGHSIPGGSSSGSSIAVSAGLAPIAVGTDTDASLTAPGIRSALYTLRPTVGLVSCEGIVPFARWTDTAGPMTKDVTDLANLMDVLVDRNGSQVISKSYTSYLDKKWKGLRIGALDPEVWQYPDWLVKVDAGATKQIIRETKAAYARIKTLVDVFHENIELEESDKFLVDGDHAMYTVFTSEFKEGMDEFLPSLAESKVRSLEELVKYNDEHTTEALTSTYPGQDKLKASLAANLTGEQLQRLRDHCKEVGSSFDKMLHKYQIDIIISPGDCFFCQYGPANGYPVAALPLATLDINGRPTGIQAIAPAHKEGLLLKLMSAWETTFPRPVPEMYRDESKPDHSL